MVRSIWTYRAVRCTLGGLFVIAAAAKAPRLGRLAEEIGDFGIVHESMLPLAAVAIVLAELVAGAALVADLRGALAAVALLVGAFSAVLTYGLWLGLDIDCHCFGEDAPAVLGGDLRTALVRNLALLGGCLYLYLWRRARRDPR